LNLFWKRRNKSILRIKVTIKPRTRELEDSSRVGFMLRVLRQSKILTCILVYLIKSSRGRGQSFLKQLFDCREWEFFRQLMTIFEFVVDEVPNVDREFYSKFANFSTTSFALGAPVQRRLLKFRNWAQGQSPLRSLFQAYCVQYIYLFYFWRFRFFFKFILGLNSSDHSKSSFPNRWSISILSNQAVSSNVLFSL